MAAKKHNIFTSIKTHFNEMDFKAAITKAIYSAVKAVLQKFTGRDKPFENAEEAKEAFLEKTTNIKVGVDEFLDGAVQGAVDAVDDTTDVVIDRGKEKATELLGGKESQFSVIIESVYAAVKSLDDKVIAKIGAGLSKLKNNSVDIIFKKINEFGDKLIAKIFKTSDESGVDSTVMQISKLDQNEEIVAKSDVITLSSSQDDLVSMSGEDSELVAA